MRFRRFTSIQIKEQKAQTNMKNVIPRQCAAHWFVQIQIVFFLWDKEWKLCVTLLLSRHRTLCRCLKNQVFCMKVNNIKTDHCCHSKTSSYPKRRYSNVFHLYTSYKNKEKLRIQIINYTHSCHHHNYSYYFTFGHPTLTLYSV